MNSVKPSIDLSLVQTFLNDQWEERVQSLTPVDEGQIARTFRFSTSTDEYFLQFTESNMAQGPKTELRFQQRFRQHGIPAREIIKRGTWDDWAFVISRRAQGKCLDQLSPPEFMQTLPSVIEALLKLSSVDVTDSTGFGWFDDQFNGKFVSWFEHLRFVGKEEDESDFFGKWHGLFDTTFLDRTLFDRYFAQMDRLLVRASPERKLIHGGYGYGNVLAEGGHVTAVIDWQDARYGDSLFDLAYLTFWQNEETSRQCVAEYQRQSQARGIHHNHFSDRVQCYHTYIGLDAMRFSAKIDNPELYRLVCTILERTWEEATTDGH